jgi:hypothetical protein
MRTAIGATAVNVAKPTNLSTPMIHALLDNIRCVTIELNGSTLYDTRDHLPCDIDKWETRARRRQWTHGWATDRRYPRLDRSPDP